VAIGGLMGCRRWLILSRHSIPGQHPTTGTAMLPIVVRIEMLSQCATLMARATGTTNPSSRRISLQESSQSCRDDALFARLKHEGVHT
jgi:hypothetical protein